MGLLNGNSFIFIFLSNFHGKLELNPNLGKPSILFNIRRGSIEMNKLTRVLNHSLSVAKLVKIVDAPPEYPKKETELTPVWFRIYSILA